LFTPDFNICLHVAGIGFLITVLATGGGGTIELTPYILGATWSKDS
jgi:hypothetical protein